MTMAVSSKSGALLSRRSIRAKKPLSSYFPAFSKAMERPWTPEDTDGNIVMVVAENRLSSHTFMSRLQQCEVPKTLDLLYYSDFRGTLPLREALGDFMSEHITKKFAVKAENLAISNGESIFYQVNGSKLKLFLKPIVKNTILFALI